MVEMVDLNFLRRGIEEGDFDDATCAGLLDVLAEVEHLRADLGLEKARKDATVRYSISLDAIQDADIVRWITVAGAQEELAIMAKREGPMRKGKK